MANINNCYKCPLCQTRIKGVWGEGNLSKPKVMFIGEAPGAEENVAGRPFVGPAGKLLRSILAEVGIDDFFITNIVKCRPKDNRDPTKEEFDACKSYLMQQIMNIQPQNIIMVGGVAAKYLLKINLSVSKLRKESYFFENIPTYVIYHPAAALYHNDYLKPIREDLKRISEII